MTCDRKWSVEACRDGRLDETERAVVARHLELCSDCREEHLRLEALRATLRSIPVRPPDAVHARRAKQRLLAAVDRDIAEPHEQRRIGRLSIVAVVVLLLVAGALARQRTTESHRPSGAPAEDAGALASAATPMGEDPPNPPPPNTEMTGRPMLPVHSILHTRPRPVSSPPAQRSASPSPARAPELAEGFEKLREGHDREAAKALEEVVSASRDALRAEDAAYLRIVALLRAGDLDEARAAAAEYIRRFPEGLHRRDVESVLGAPP